MGGSASTVWATVPFASSNSFGPISASGTLPSDLVNINGATFHPVGSVHVTDTAHLPEVSFPSNLIEEDPSSSKPERPEDDRETQPVRHNRHGKLVFFAPNLQGDKYHVLTIGSTWNNRISYVIQRLMLLPTRFVEVIQSPMTHRSMYEGPDLQTPQAILDALAACSLYNSRTDQNRSFASSNIIRKSGDIASMASIPFASSMDLLASTQALLFYQIIMLFDGDARMRLEAAKNEKALRNLCDQLLQRVGRATILVSDSNATSADPITTCRGNPDHPMNPTSHSVSSESNASGDSTKVGPETPLHHRSILDLEFTSEADSATREWLDWVYQESARRTVLVSHVLIGCFEFSKVGKTYTPQHIVQSTYTASAAMWDASSQLHWRDAASTKFQWPVCYEHWEDTMRGVQPHELDELGIWIMVVVQGMKFTRDWLGKDLLFKYGLEWHFTED
jgi:hypothetical protein